MNWLPRICTAGYWKIPDDLNSIKPITCTSFLNVVAFGEVHILKINCPSKSNWF